MKKYFVGIDTSNYTTSLAIIDEKGRLIANLKEPLPVKSGERGLRQSDALFFHVKNLPVILSRAQEYLADAQILAIGASEKPRNLDGSYMPCFLAGIAARDSMVTTSKARSYGFSHQCGHIMAILYGSDRTDLLNEKFVAFHLSGGTTEMLSVIGQGNSFNASVIGGTKDLNAGQIIDRIGVCLGLDFPCGKSLEELALKYKEKIPRKKISVNGLSFNLSGLENMAKELFESTGSKELTAAFVFDYISGCLERVCENYEVEKGRTTFVFGGGVSSNSIIRNRISSKFDTVFAEPQLCTDNAVGIAVLTLNRFKTEM